MDCVQEDGLWRSSWLCVVGHIFLWNNVNEKRLAMKFGKNASSNGLQYYCKSY